MSPYGRILKNYASTKDCIACFSFETGGLITKTKRLSIMYKLISSLENGPYCKQSSGCGSSEHMCCCIIFLYRSPAIQDLVHAYVNLVCIISCHFKLLCTVKFYKCVSCFFPCSGPH